MLKDFERVNRLLSSGLKDIKVLVVGDVMLDRYYFGEVKRISPEAPVPVTRVLSEKEVLGGAANVAKNLARLGCKVEIVGVTGDDGNRKRLCRLFDEEGIGYRGLLTVNRPTTTKLRVIGGHQQMLRLDFEETGKLAAGTVRKLKTVIEELLSESHCLIISDYAKGVCDRGLCQGAIQTSSRLNIPAVVDPKGADWRPYAGADFITPNLKELSEAVHAAIPNRDNDVTKAAERLRRRYSIENIVVTRSEQGLSLVGEQETCHIPTRAQEVFDVSGAGDTVIAVLGAAIAGGLPPEEAAQLANMAAGIAVGKLGTYAVGREELTLELHRQVAETSECTCEKEE